MDPELKRLELVGWLGEGLTRNPGSGIEVTHSLGTAGLPDPEPIEGHQPDLLARGPGGKLVIGLARIGPAIGDDDALEDYRFFGAYREPGADETAALNVAVPGDSGPEAEAALEQAGLTPEQFNLVPLGGFSG